MADIFQEVDEDLKKDQYLELWRKYGRLVVTVVVAFVVGTAGWVGWQNYQTSQRMAQGRHYEAALALARGGKIGEAVAAFGAIATDGGGTGYGAVAGLREGALKAGTGDIAGAVAAYDRVAADSGADPELRNLAILLAVLHDLDKGEPAALAARIEPLAAETSPWRHTALELSALIALRGGDNAKAKGILTRLADDTTAPAALRRRAGELLAVLGG